MTSESVRSPLKWAGGKRWLVPLLRLFWTGDTRWVEPCCGGMSVALRLCPKKALLNDINPHSICFFKHLQRGLVIQIPLENNAETYYRYRAQFNKLIQLDQQASAEAASLFYYLNRTGYNGLCRFNQSGEFNVPFGQHEHIRYRTNFLDYQSILKPWMLQNTDFAAIKLKKNDFIYADPPYDVPFTQYSGQVFTWSEQVRLLKWLCAHKGPVILSNQATDRIIKLYQEHGFDVCKLQAPRSISCKGDRAPVTEVLAFRGISEEKIQVVRQSAKKGGLSITESPLVLPPSPRL